MKRILLIIIVLTCFSGYLRSQGNDAFASNSVQNGALALNASPALELSPVGDQDESPLLTFYPNPVKDNLNIKFRERGNYVVRIYNVVGSKIKEKRVEDDNIIKIDLSELQKGMYFLSFEPGNGKVITKTFTKEEN
jgi:hypothetical protein